MLLVQLQICVVHFVQRQILVKRADFFWGGGAAVVEALTRDVFLNLPIARTSCRKRSEGGDAAVISSLIGAALIMFLPNTMSAAVSHISFLLFTPHARTCTCEKGFEDLTRRLPLLNAQLALWLVSITSLYQDTGSHIFSILHDVPP